MPDYITLAGAQGPGHRGRTRPAGVHVAYAHAPHHHPHSVIPFGLSGAIRGYRWFGISVEPIIPRRLGH
jgi:hypothetical protein